MAYLLISEKTHVMPKASCPVCGTVVDAATGGGIEDVGDAAPVEGDITLCSKCGSCNTFTNGMGLRVVTDEEFVELPYDVRTTVRRMASLLKRLNDGKRPS